MKTMMIPTGLCLLLSSLGVARADVWVSSPQVVVEPTAPVPAMLPPPPPAALPSAPVYVAAAPSPTVVAPSAAGGQWVFTAQYGWVYMPYGSHYVVTSGSPYAYVYGPTLGWRWLSAPWVIGSGPYPYFGSHGPFAYAWYRGLRAGHPMTVHYAHVNGPAPVRPRATFAPVYHASGMRPAVRPNVAPTRATVRPTAVAWQRNPGLPRPAAAGRR